MTYASRTKMSIALGATGLALLVFVGLAFWRAHQALNRANVEVAEENNLRFTTTRLDRPVPSAVEWISAPAVFDDAAIFRNRLYISGPTGLLEYAPDGKLIARYRVGLELPSAPLVSVVPGMAAKTSEQEIYAATAGAGLVIFGEKEVRQVLPERDACRHLTAILPLSTGRLLLGTAKNGVLVYNGEHINTFHPRLSKLPVTALAGTAANFWVGTNNQGVFHWHAGQVDQFNEAEGLPDPRVLSLAAEGERAFVGTPMGVAEFREGRFTRVLASGFFARSLLIRGPTLIVGTLDEGTLEVPLTARGPKPMRPRGHEFPGEVRRLLADGDRLFALTDSGFFALDEGAENWRQLIAGEDSLLTDRNISALAFDPAGQLWIGYFDRGLDILDPRAQHVTHIENDHVFCVNRIVHDRDHDHMLVATANGLVVFDRAGTQKQVLGRQEGLIANHISDIAFTSDSTTLATPAGITTLNSSGARSIYAFQGLVNNHVYALGASGSRVLAGTLGGLSVLQDGRVLANYTTANSGLRHNWITALVPVGDDWFVGTYGGGILRFDSAGQWQSFPDATGAFDVNPNAMLATDYQVYAGTLGTGLYVFDRASERWKVVTAWLPSTNVTAVAVHEGYVYVGTDNGLVRWPVQELNTR
jgi:ligand-binding sensor domain-containing protein